MRDIKFRVWKEDKMIYSDQYHMFYEFFEQACLDEDKSMMFTGVVDKNGKEIYEGDLLIFQKGVEGEEKYPYEVVFNYGKFELRCPDIKMHIDIGYHREMKVVGNIFEK